MSKLIESDQEGYPKVRITNGALRAMGGDVSVDLDALHELVRDDLGLRRNITPRFVLYGRSKIPPLLGLHLPYTRTAFVQLPASEMRGRNEHYTRLRSGASEILVHEATHLVDSWDRPIRTAAETAARGVATIAAAKGASLATELPLTPESFDPLLSIYAFMKLRFGVYYEHIDPAEKRANANQNSEYLQSKYQDLITYPNRPIS